MGYDIGLSLSGSSSATSGADLRGAFGDFNFQPNKANPWIWPLAIVGAVLVATLFLIRRF